MTSFSWFSGKSEPSRKFMAVLCVGIGAGGAGSEGGVANDAGALHLAVARRVVHHRVVLGRAVVPEGEGVLRPAEAHLVLGNGCLADEVLQQLGRAGGVVLAVAHVPRRMEVGEMGREGVHE